MQLNGDDAIVPPPDSAYEFDATATVDTDPPSSSEPPKDVPESPVRSGEEQEPEPSRHEEPPSFDPRYKRPFLGLLYVGYLEATFEFMHHKFKIVTPTRRERLQMSLTIADYQGTSGWDLAFQAGVVSAYLVEIDGEKLPEPVLNNPKETAFTERFNWVTENIQDIVMDEVYTKCLELDGQVQNTLVAMGKAPG